MEKDFQKLAGYSLITGSVFLILTMVLHPSGGSIEHMLKIRTIAMASHSIAIFSLPFVAFGFYGLALQLHTSSRLSMLAFILLCQGLIAAMIAATINGLTLPLFVSKHASEPGQDVALLKLIASYGFAINKPMDYIFIGAISLAMGIWSGLVVRTAAFPKWIGYYGIFLVLLAAIGLVVGFDFIHLTSFRIYVFGTVSWIVLVGYYMVAYVPLKK